MQHFNRLDQVETQIVRLSELTALFRVIVAGAEHTMDMNDVVSSINYVEGSLVDINENLRESFQALWDEIRDSEEPKEKRKGKHNKD